MMRREAYSSIILSIQLKLISMIIINEAIELAAADITLA